MSFGPVRGPEDLLSSLSADPRVVFQRRPLSTLVPADYNPRAMTPTARAALAASLARFGLVQPLVANLRSEAKGWPAGSSVTLVGGHQRAAALKAQGELDAYVALVDLSPLEEKALNVALNSSTVAGEFTAGLGGLLEEIKGGLPELSSALGFPGLVVDAAELSSKAGKDLAGISESSLSGQAPPRASFGDLWECGPHRVVCGDARSRAAIALAMGDAKADLVYTDPPYGVAYEAPSGKHGAIAGDGLTRDALLGLLVPALTQAAAAAKDGAAFYLWHASTTRDEFSFALKAAGLQERQYIVWAKPQLVLGHADYHWAHEPCFYAAKAGQSPAWYGGREQTTVWRIEQRSAGGEVAVVLGPGLVVTDGKGGEVTLLAAAPKRKLRALRISAGEKVLVRGDDGPTTLWEVARDVAAPEHPTQKPVALAARAMLNSTKEGDHALDMFAGAGAGAALLAAEQLRRICHLVELEPRYVDVAVARWEALTRKKAVRHPADPAKSISKRKAVK